jgi:hypothetical protein
MDVYLRECMRLYDEHKTKDGTLLTNNQLRDLCKNNEATAEIAKSLPDEPDGGGVFDRENVLQALLEFDTAEMYETAAANRVKATPKKKMTKHEKKKNAKQRKRDKKQAKRDEEQLQKQPANEKLRRRIEARRDARSKGSRREVHELNRRRHYDVATLSLRMRRFFEPKKEEEEKEKKRDDDGPRKKEEEKKKKLPDFLTEDLVFSVEHDTRCIDKEKKLFVSLPALAMTGTIECGQDIFVTDQELFQAKGLMYAAPQAVPVLYRDAHGVCGCFAMADANDVKRMFAEWRKRFPQRTTYVDVEKELFEAVNAARANSLMQTQAKHKHLLFSKEEMEKAFQEVREKQQQQKIVVEGVQRPLTDKETDELKTEGDRAAQRLAEMGAEWEDSGFVRGQEEEKKEHVIPLMSGTVNEYALAEQQELQARVVHSVAETKKRMEEGEEEKKE